MTKSRYHSNALRLMEARLEGFLWRVPDWRFQPQKEVQLAVATRELACKALSEGAAILEVAERLHLPIGTVRRLAGQLQPKDFRRSIAQIVLSWLPSLWIGSKRSKISAGALADLLGADRVNLLVAYSGLRCDQLLNSLSHEIDQLTQMIAMAKAANYYPLSSSGSNDKTSAVLCESTN